MDSQQNSVGFPSQIPPDKKQNGKLIIALTIALILLPILTGISGYYLGAKSRTANNVKVTPAVISPTDMPTETPDVKENWKNYKSESLGFAIKYPSEMVITESKKNVSSQQFPNQDSVTFKLNKTQTEPLKLLPVVNLSFVSCALGTRTLEQYARAEAVKSANNSKITQPIESSTFNGMAAFTYAAQGVGLQRYTFISPQKNTCMLIVDGSDYENYPENESTVQDILSTFVVSK